MGRSVLPSRIYARPSRCVQAGKAGDFAIGGANIDTIAALLSGINRAPRHSENTISTRAITGTRPMAMRLPLKISAARSGTGYRHQGNWRPGRWAFGKFEINVFRHSGNKRRDLVAIHRSAIITGIAARTVRKSCHGWLKQSSTPLPPGWQGRKRQDFITRKDKRDKDRDWRHSRAVEIIAGLPTATAISRPNRDRHGQGIWH